jgi:flagellar motility protein MotE (MotC chaperone)
MKWMFRGLGLAAFLSLPTAFAGDCTVSFGQSCLSSAYNREQVERDHELREVGITAVVKTREEQAIEEAKEERERVSEAREERRPQQRLQAYQDQSAERLRKYEERLKAMEKKDEHFTYSFFNRRKYHFRYR